LKKSVDDKEKSKTPACVESLPSQPSDEDIVRLAQVQEYKTAVTELLNEGEDVRSLDRYKNAVKRLLFSSAEK